jgi:hypothetical protein
MSRLNYNKWDNLQVRARDRSSRTGWADQVLSRQLSDDSDIEVHPNVDKRSMIR